MSAYVYASNDPTMLVDPSGESALATVASKGAISVTQRSAQIALGYVERAAAISRACLKTKAVTVACTIAAMSFIWLGWEALKEEDPPAVGSARGDDYWDTTRTPPTTGSVDATESQTSTDTDEQEHKCKNRPGCMVHHYTSFESAALIWASRKIEPSPWSGLTYLSPDRYESRRTAQYRLAMENEPDCKFAVPFKNVRSPSQFSVVQSDFGLPGGGTEFTTRHVVPTGGRGCQPLVP